MDPDPLPYISTIFLASNVIWIQLFLVLILLIGSALISGAEVAFFSLQLKSLEDSLESDADPTLERVINQLKNPKRLLGVASLFRK